MAGAGLGGPLEPGARRALLWIEGLDHPVIAAPHSYKSQTLKTYVPNNDLDSVGGDPGRIAEIRRSEKVVIPRLLDNPSPFLYAWAFDENGDSLRQVGVICDIAERLYQFGRGVDFACAWGEVLDQARLEDELFCYPGTVHRPSQSGTDVTLKCPVQGSLESLEDRYRGFGMRFNLVRSRRGTTRTFTKSSMRRFALVGYNTPPHWRQMRTWALERTALCARASAANHADSSQHSPKNDGHNPARHALALVDSAHSFARIHRYESNCDRVFARSLDRFVKLRAIHGPTENFSGQNLGSD